MNPELEKLLNQVLIVLVPLFVAWAKTKLSKTSKDLDAAFQKIRAHEEELGIQTKVVGGKLRVTTRADDFENRPSVDPEPFHKKGG